MRRRSATLSYYGKNIARQIQQKHLHGKRLESERVDENRQATAHVIGICYLVALNDKYGIGEQRLRRVADAAEAEAGKYDLNKRSVGAARAKKKLDEDLDDLLPGGFLLPITRPPKTNRDWLLLGEQREAAELVVKMYAIATHRALKFGAERISEAVKGAEENFRKFGEWGEGSDCYRYALLVRQLSAILGEPVEVDERNAGEPIFSNTLD